jgi:hypothetical protein
MVHADEAESIASSLRHCMSAEMIRSGGLALIGRRMKLVQSTAVEALAGEDGQLGQGQIEPAAVLRAVAPFDPLDDAARLGRFEGFIGRRRHMLVQLVLHADLPIGKRGRKQQGNEQSTAQHSSHRRTRAVIRATRRHVDDPPAP